MGRRLYPLALVLLPALAAAHPRRAIKQDGTAQLREFVAGAPDPRGHVLARQVMPATASTDVSRVIYLNNNGVTLHPGDNDASTQTSSIVTEETDIGGWDIDQDSWNQLVGCVTDMYSRWNITVTDQDPGASVSHIEALIGGSPLDLGLPDNVAGISPFTSDCGVIPNSIVFTFTDILDDNPQLVCEIISQEIAHSFGLDHELLAEDPMTYLDYAGPRTFQDSMAHCGEYDERECGINGSVCRKMQSSVQMLDQRLGLAGSDPTTVQSSSSDPMSGGCATGRGNGWVIGILVLMVRKRSRRA
jgi:hypothetical protein